LFNEIDAIPPMPDYFQMPDGPQKMPVKPSSEAISPKTKKRKANKADKGTFLGIVAIGVALLISVLQSNGVEFNWICSLDV
jgi:hypothetical protein